MQYFAKYHGLGNDYLIVDGRALASPPAPDKIRLLCDRHRGPGGDGLLVVAASRGADFGVHIYNPDGSETEKSGNGLRILARWLWDQGEVGSQPFTVDVLGGQERVLAQVHPGPPLRVTVDMGHASFRPLDVPTTLEGPEVVEVPLVLEGRTLKATAVGLGNPHCVFFPEDELDLAWLGPRVENHSAFPRRTNVQIARVLGPNQLAVTIWERGAGITQASGSSACAAAAAAVRTGRMGGEVEVVMPGGILNVWIGKDFSIKQQGPVELVMVGQVGGETLERLSEP